MVGTIDFLVLSLNTESRGSERKQGLDILPGDLEQMKANHRLMFWSLHRFRIMPAVWQPSAPS